jgi:DNA ligase-1
LAGAGLDQFRLRVGQPVGPMLAQAAASTDSALATLGGEAAFEWKLDGARIQVHRDGDEIGLFTRTLDDVTARMPEVVAAVRAWPVRSLIADGEVISVRPDGRPAPFQVTASRFGSRTPGAADAVRLSPFLFDLLHVDGADLLDEPGRERATLLHQVVPETDRVPRLVTDDPLAARAFLAEALQRGHEGVVAKSLAGPYEAGRRGSGWLKVKPVHTLDLVVLAVEWGSGRRKGWLSNLHLGARDPRGAGFVMLGKTFKGMTDAMLQWQTERFLTLASGPSDGYVVHVRPEQVVEIAFDGVQRSSRYPGGVALRFARVLRYRDDKPASEADTLDAVRAFFTDGR